MDNNTNESKPLTNDEWKAKYNNLINDYNSVVNKAKYILMGGVMFGTIGSLILDSKINPRHDPTNAITKDVNKDGIEDIITYNPTNKNLKTFIGIKDSSKTITYVEAERFYKEKQDSLKAQYDRQKIDLEKALENINFFTFYFQQF
jgi:hypothetical protein